MSDQPTSAHQETAASAPPMAGLARLDRDAQLTVGGGIVVAVAGLLGVALDSWSLEYAGLVFIVLGAVGAGLAWLASERRLPALPMAPADLVLAFAAAAAVLGVLAGLTLLADLDQLDETGGILGVVVTVVLGVAGVAMLVGATRSGAVDVVAAARQGGRGARIGLAGAALAVLGWVGNLTIGVWNFSPAAVVVTLIALAAVALAAATVDRTGRERIPLSWIAVVVAALAALVMLDHFRAFSGLMEDSGLGVDNWIVFLVYAAGVIALLAGAALAAYDERLRSAPAAAV